MSLKALAEAALQQCALRTLPAQHDVNSTAQCNGEIVTMRTLPSGESDAMRIATRAIAMAALTDEQRLSRLADLQRDPAIARFWALVWLETRSVAPDEDA